MHISHVNILQMVNDKANSITAIKYEVAYVLSISIFRFDMHALKVMANVMYI